MWLRLLLEFIVLVLTVAERPRHDRASDSGHDSNFHMCSDYKSRSSCPQPDCYWTWKSCQSVCRKYSSKTCPAPKCRVTGWSSKCVPQDLARCGSKQCPTDDCVPVPKLDDGIDCFPKCYRFGIEDCPRPMCKSHQGGPCEPADLASLKCIALKKEQCIKLAPDRCKWLGEPGTIKKLMRKLFRSQDTEEGFCEDLEFVQAWESVRDGQISEFDYCSGLGLNHCERKAFSRNCKIRSFFQNQTQVHQRCTLNWQHDERLQMEILQFRDRVLKIRHQSGNGAKKFAWHSKKLAFRILLFALSVFGAVLAVASVGVDVVGTIVGTVIALVPLVGPILEKAIYGDGNGLMGTIAEIMRVPEETALDIDLNNMQHEMWMPYVRELHLKWSGVSLPSIKFCESVFKNHSGISEQSVRDISHYLEHAEGECVQKLRGGNPDGRIGKLGHKIALDLRDVCAELCMGLVDALHHSIASILLSGKKLDDVCAEHVVRPIESNALSCCADRCGWTGRYCSNWPFMSNESRSTWIAQCCTEYQIVAGSSRQLMCNSLADQDEKKNLTAHDQPEFSAGTKLAAIAGYTPSLLKLGRTHPKSGEASFMQSLHGGDDKCQEKFHQRMKDKCGVLGTRAMEECQRARPWIGIKTREANTDGCGKLKDMFERGAVQVQHPDDCRKKLQQNGWAVEMRVRGSLEGYALQCFHHSRSRPFQDCYGQTTAGGLRNRLGKAESMWEASFLLLA